MDHCSFRSHVMHHENQIVLCNNSMMLKKAESVFSFECLGVRFIFTFVFPKTNLCDFCFTSISINVF